jgi:hypothetical protein
LDDLLTQLRHAAASVAANAHHVSIDHAAIPAYAASLPLDAPLPPPAPEADAEAHLQEGDREELAAFWLTLDAINFGSGWFPTLRKRPGRSGYYTIAGGIRDRFAARGPWTASELQQIETEALAQALGQDPRHELMGLFARSLRDLGCHVADDHGGHFCAVIDAAGGSATAFVSELAGWACFADTSIYDGLEVPFLKRAQIAAADLERAGVARFWDLERLTMFADNLVPHVLRLDGILSFDRELVRRIERGELIEHDSGAEIEIRACAVHAVERIVRERPESRAAQVDQLLWLRGQGPNYKSSPRHRTRCTAY